MNRPSLNKNKAVTYIIYFLVFLAAWIATYYRFHLWYPKIFYADDINNLSAFYSGQFAHTLTQSLFGAYLEKYRPIFGLICHILYSNFGSNIEPYLTVNIILQSINGLLFFVIASKLSKNDFFIPFILTLLFVTSRFALYQVTQVTGILEGSALSFFLLMLYALYQTGESKHSQCWSWLSILFLFLAIYTHERYLIVAPWLAITLFFIPRTQPLSFKTRYFLLLGCLALCLSNILCKSILLHIPFWVGTGGTHISVDFHIIEQHLLEALFSIFGFNYGPAYLVGQQVNNLMWLAASLYSALWFSLITTALIFKKNMRFYLIALVLLAMLILIPPMITIRMEARWEYTSFLLFLLCFAWAHQTAVDYNKTSATFIILACLSMFLIDCKISKHFEVIFIIDWRDYGITIKNDILVPARTPPGYPFIVQATPDICASVASTKIFEIYEGKARTVYCVSPKLTAKEIRKKYPHLILFSFTPKKFIYLGS